MLFGLQLGNTYTYAQSAPFCCHQFPTMDLDTFLITSEPEAALFQFRSENLSLRIELVWALNIAPWP